MEKIKIESHYEFEIVFKDPNSENVKSVFCEIDDLLNKTLDDFFEELDDEPCNSSGCNNESFSGCDCGSPYEDYEFLNINLIIRT